MGGKTYVLSLPSQWVKKYRIQKGEELDIEEKENTIVISVDRLAVNNDLEVNFKDLNLMLGRAIGGLYKAGYTKVKVLFQNNEQFKIIEDTLHRTCVGFEITKQDKNFVIIESLAEVKIEEFDNSIKRLFYSLELMGEDLYKGLKENDKELLKRVVDKDSQVNRLADFCRRVINTGETQHIIKPNVLYYVVEQLERIGDIYKKIAKYSIEHTVKKEQLVILFDVNEFFIFHRKLFYNFNNKDLEDFGLKYNLISNKFISLNSSDFVSFNLKVLLDSLFDLNGALITRNMAQQN